MLNESTDLGSRPVAFFPDVTGAEGVLTHFLQPLVNRYLLMLSDLEEPDSDAISKFTRELEMVIDSTDHVQQATQLAVAGIYPAGLFTTEIYPLEN